MGTAHLTLDEARAMFIELSARLEASKDLLTQADKAIGDGDHGVGMARGFEAVRRKLEGQEFASVGALLQTIGATLLSSVGGASGAVFGILFMGGAKHLNSRPIFDSPALSSMLGDGLQAVQERGKAKPGDKTMVDALQPAALTAADMTSAPLDQALAAVAEAARQGMEKTKEFVAAVGKARSLGERAVGHPDPGAVSVYLILKFMSEHVARRQDGGE